MSAPLKMPHLMKDVYEQIGKHPGLKDLSQGTLVGLQAASSGWSYTTAANNKFVRQVWKHLYLGEPLK